MKRIFLTLLVSVVLCATLKPLPISIAHRGKPEIEQYVSEKLMFSVDYPKGWFIESENDEISVIIANQEKLFESGALVQTGGYALVAGIFPTDRLYEEIGLESPNKPSLKQLIADAFSLDELGFESIELSNWLPLKDSTRNIDAFILKFSVKEPAEGAMILTFLDEGIILFVVTAAAQGELQMFDETTLDIIASIKYWGTLKDLKELNSD